ncbi:unnamed protein product [Amoebophrya sp. A120]|nr:unnamed protein product [Amoebophrya sp. A120]|eukprot:GSA120T00010981001.1
MSTNQGGATGSSSSSGGPAAALPDRPRSPPNGGGTHNTKTSSTGGPLVGSGGVSSSRAEFNIQEDDLMNTNDDDILGTSGGGTNKRKDPAVGAASAAAPAPASGGADGKQDTTTSGEPVEKKHVELEVFRPNGSSFLVPMEETELAALNSLEEVLTMIRECPNTDQDVRDTPICWLELCGHNHDLPSYGTVLDRNSNKSLELLQGCGYMALIFVKPFQEEGESYVDVLDNKCDTVETASYVIGQMTDEELNKDYQQERHGAMSLLQYLREKEAVVLAIIGSLPRFTRILDPHPERHQSCLSDACRLGQKRAVEAIFENTHTPEDLITCPNEHRATYLHQACYNGHMPIVKFILEHSRFPTGIDLWVRGNTHNATCMHLACCRPQLEVAKFLVDHPKCPKDLLNWGNKHSATCLHLACEDAHLNVVEFLVKNQRCRDEKLILQQNKNGFTCLHLAIQKGHLEVVKSLLNNSDSMTVDRLIPLQTKNGNTCFHITCQEGFVQIMELLWFQPDVPKASMVGAQDKDGYNCLNDACYYGHLPLIEFFFNHWPERGTTQHHAEHSGSYGNSARSQPGSSCSGGQNAQEQKTGGRKKITDSSARSSGGNDERDQANDDPTKDVLNQAAGGPESPGNHQPERRNNADWDDEISLVSQSPDDGFPSLTDLIFSVSGGIGNCLHVACSRGHLSIVEFLCKPKGLPPSGGLGQVGDVTGGEHLSQRSSGGDDDEQEYPPAENSSSSPYPYNDVSDNDSSEVGPEQFYAIEQLVLSKNKHNASGLHLASIKGHLEIAKFLVDGTGLSRDKKRDFMGLQNKKGASCLHFACYHGNVDVVKYLVDHEDCPKELVQARNRNHYTCLHSACDEGRHEVIEFLCKSDKFPIELLAAQARSNTILHKVCEYGYLNIVKLLVEQSIQASEQGVVSEQQPSFKPDTLVMYRNNLGDTCLHVAAAEGHLLIVEYLVKSPAAEKYNLLFSKNKQDMTCLQLACSEGHLNVVESLMNFCTTNDNTGKRKELITHSLNVYHATCLFSACEAGHTNIVEYLLDHKHFPPHLINAQTKYGTSCLHAACEKGFMDIVQFLMNHKHCTKRLVLCKDRGAQTCLDLAKCEGHFEIVELIQNHATWGPELAKGDTTEPAGAATVLNTVATTVKRWFGREDSKSP